MSIDSVFRLLKTTNKIALITYMVAGYPDFDTSYKAFDILLEHSDMLEIGFPFSDPVADGPTIQEAHSKALQNGITHKDIFNLSKSLKQKHNKPLLLMTYFNPIFKIGVENFINQAKESNIDGFIIPDLPAEESKDIKEIIEQHGLSLVMLLAPTSFKSNRIGHVCKASTDFVYMVSITGITGERNSLPIDNIKEYIDIFKKSCNKPIVVGFGISNTNHINTLKHYADGVVIGSHLIKTLNKGGLELLKTEIKALNEATYL